MLQSILAQLKVVFMLTDISPPVITCPLTIIGNTDPESPTKMVTWTLPIASDNAELYDPNAKPKVTSSHPFVSSPFEFAIGTTRIVYTATDKSNLTASCTLTITVTGKSEVNNCIAA